ncbi:hypothetical protein [Serratia nevei]|uniref:hypothetical protein n=1 Tax=Serratia nevei TaxID=2703794 RepID=UPI0011CBE427|nr:hypothetical protein [Serratia nevei]TXE73222.1 hypothetical protein FOT59_12655 [Serratia nevei]
MSEQNGGSLVYQVDIDTAKMITGSRRASVVLEEMEKQSGKAEASLSKLERQAGSTGLTLGTLPRVAKAEQMTTGGSAQYWVGKAGLALA